MVEPVAGVGARVRRLREARGWSQQALAQAAGLSITVVALIEQGKREDPKLSTVAALARALGVGLDDLAGEGRRKGG
jgi:transcriptional regulator with XRE-family HTH domain